MNILILRSEHIMFWELLLRNFSIPSKKIEEKMPFQRFGSAG